MNFGDDSYSTNERVEWWEQFTRLYIQEIYSKDPAKTMAELYFRPLTIDASKFYSSCNTESLKTITKIQLSLLEECCISFQKEHRRPSQLFFKIEPRVIAHVSKLLSTVINNLKLQRIDLVLDINVSPRDLRCKVWKKALLAIVEQGHYACLGGINWRDSHCEDLKISGCLFKYVRLGPPPQNIAEINHFIDTCFYVVEHHGVNLIVDKIQSKTDLELACRTPYFGLLGEYISSAHMAKDTDIVMSGVTL